MRHLSNQDGSEGARHGRASTDVLDEFIATCRSLVVGENPVVKITRAMEQLIAEPTALAAQIPRPDLGSVSSVAGFDEILFEDESLTVFVVHSAPDVQQPPHDHLISAVIGVYEGIEEQRYFRRDGGSLLPIGGADIGPGDVLTLGPAAVHAIGRPCSPEGLCGGKVAVGRCALEADRWSALRSRDGREC